MHKIAGATLLFISLLGCTDTKKDSDTYLSFHVYGLQGNIKVVDKNASSFFVSLSSDKSWHIRALDTDSRPITWVTINPANGLASRDVNIIASVSENNGEERTAWIIADNSVLSDTIILTQQGVVKSTSPSSDETSTPIDLAPSSAEHVSAGSDPTLIEVPRLSGNSTDWFVSYRVNGAVNYSIEWNSYWKNPRWVCFTFDSTNRGKNTRRTDAWNVWDKITPSQNITQSWYRGYDRGHMVASSDRLQSADANRQTFYYTNMTPQLAGLNQQFWNELEQWVQDRARNGKSSDVMYVTKGIAFNNGTPTHWVHNHQMAVPDYYYMAIVLRSSGVYHGIGFWVEHRAISKSEMDPSDVAMTIGDIERLASVDLFHNLPDNIEASIEKESPFSGFWQGIRR